MLYMCDVKLLEVFKWMWLMLDVMRVLCKMIRWIEKNVIDVRCLYMSDVKWLDVIYVWGKIVKGVEMNGVKIKTVKKIKSNL